ncbi:hypothetical protein BDQ17DRAFT_1429030 [Cyathus striatus]|nr:hypothetical protein BDQ17DRAFT_1429030 [Cyathus striatus]
MDIIKDIVNSIPSKTSLTFDLWTSASSDEQLAFETVQGHHNGVNIAGILLCTINHYNLHGKLGWITSDGASVNRTTIQELKKLLTFNDIKWTTKEHDILYMEHAIHLSAKHFVQTVAPASTSNLSKNIKAALKKSSHKGDLDLDELDKELAEINLEAENEDEGAAEAKSESEEVAIKGDDDDNYTFHPGDSLGKALALVKQIHKSPQA